MFLVLIVLAFQCLHFSIAMRREVVSHDYCVIGAGPAGIQNAYFLHEAKKDYILFERSNTSGAFFTHFPRHRKLISINKRFTGEKNEEFNMRHDWNSLLSSKNSDKKQLKMTSYSNQIFPKADNLVEYLQDFVNLHELNIKHNTEIKNINCIDFSHENCGTKDMYSEQHNGKKIQCNKYEMYDQNGNYYNCKIVIVSSGLATPNIPDNFKEAEGYESVSINPKDYEGKTVLILGRGNSAFELAQSIYGSTNYIHLVSRSRVRNAFSTHYVGDVRTVNNDILDTYQLKSLDGFTDIDLNNAELVKWNNKFYLIPKSELYNTKNPLEKIKDSSLLRVGYDRVIRCLGFKFDYSIFNNSMKFSSLDGRTKKYPVIGYDYESKDYSNLYFSGTIAHSLDFRKASGGFIHGFRYTIRAMHNIMNYRYHEIKWPSIELPITKLINTFLKRISEAAGTYQMFGQLVDIISLKTDDGSFEYFEEFPLGLVKDFARLTGKQLSKFIIVNFEYGSEFSGPGKDVFKLGRATGDVEMAHESNFLHPVLYYFDKMPKIDENDPMSIVEKADKVHHIIEDFLTFWIDSDSHQLHLRRFFEDIIDTDLRNYSSDECVGFFLAYGSYPESCKRYFHAY